MPLPLLPRREPSVKRNKATSLTAKIPEDINSDFGVPIRRAIEPVKEKEELSTPSSTEKKPSKRTSDPEDVERLLPAKDTTTKVKKSKSRKKKSGNAIDDIFGALK
ncbi:hypothetical protein F66182_15769 [Fusarium sp. NRRL 66182]|nr:hypothetical protein F66182_15769 [Fusarium sp. NRRL 66182]